MKKINLPSREKKILSILNAKHGIVTGKDLSTKIMVSERTIRSDVSNINTALESVGIQIRAIHGKGYTLTVEDRETLHEIFSEEQNYITKEDRMTALLLKLLREDDWCDIGCLEDEMYVSSTTIEKDIRLLDKSISQQHPFLAVERRGNSIRLEDDERKKRDILTRFYAKNWDYDSKEGIILKYDELGNDILKSIQDSLKIRLQASGTHLDDYAFIYLTLAIAVMFFRVKDGHVVEAHNRGKIDPDIKLLLDSLAGGQQLQPGAGEYEYLSEIKEQLVFLCMKTYSKNYVLNHTDIICHEIVNNLLYEMYDEYGVDFTEDDKLFVDLTRHVQALISGIVAPHIQNHVLGDELRRKNPFLGDIARFMRKQLAEKCGIELGIDEEDYLLPFIILAEEELYKKRRKNGIPTAVISHYNESMTHYLMELLQRHYGRILDLHGPYAMCSKEQIRKEEMMLVLTTVRMEALHSYFKIPTLTISPMIDHRDQAGIDLYLTSLKSTYMYQVPQEQMEAYFLSELCYRMPEKRNLNSALSQMERRIQEAAGLEVLRPIDLNQDYYCHLSNGILFCYQIVKEIHKTVVSLVDLQKDLSCKQVRNINAVMYMLMPPGEKHTLGWFYYMAMAFAQYPGELRAVFDGKSVEDLSININRNIER